jgi:hypothetical protein
VKPVIVASQVKGPAEAARPLGVVTEIRAVLGQAPAGTFAWIRLEFMNFNVVAGIPLNLTAVLPSFVNPVPLIVTVVSAGPWLGIKLVRVASHVKSLADVAVPLGVITEIRSVPGQAPAGTITRIRPELSTVKVAETSLLN